jgi:copper(I)-binding protein
MLTDLKGPLVAGQSFAVSLTFEKAGKIDVTAIVEKVGAMAPGSMPGMKM